MPHLTPYKGYYYFWKFLPNPYASIAFIILYIIMTALLSYRMYKHRSWFCIAFVLGCISEIIGYVSRAAAYWYSGSLIAFLFQAMFLVLAPVFYAATIYMTLSRIMRCVKGEHLSIIPTKWLTRIFVLGDYISLSVQGNAAGLTSSSKPGLPKIGEDMVVAGLFIQLALLVAFFTTAIVFQKRLGENPTRESRTTELPWKQSLYIIYGTTALIFLRSVFRVVEYIQGIDGYTQTHEWTLYTFDGVPMFIVAVVFLIWFPGSIQSALDEAARNRIEMGDRVSLNGSDAGASSHLQLRPGPLTIWDVSKKLYRNFGKKG